MSTRWTIAMITFHLFWFSGTLITIILVLLSTWALSTTVLSSRLACITDFALKIFTSLALSCNYAKAFDCVDHNKLENSFFFFFLHLCNGSHFFFFCCINLNINHLFIHLNYFKKVNIYSSQINGVTFPPRYIFPS